MATVENNLANRAAPIPGWARTTTLILCSYAVFGSSFSFLGWAFDIPRLTDWSSRGISIQPNAAIAALIIGLAVAFFLFGKHRVAILLGSIGALIGTANVFQTVTSIDLGIDTALMFGRDWGSGSVETPGRMGIPASLSWILLGLSVVFVSFEARFRKGAFDKSLRIKALAIAALAMALSALSLTAYLLGAEVLYSLPRFTAISMQTATFIFALSISIVLAIPDLDPVRLLYEKTSAGTMTRVILPAIIAAPLILGLLISAGQRSGIFDVVAATAIAIVTEVILLLGLLWWAGRNVRLQEKRAVVLEREAQRSRTELENLADAMPQAVWIADANGKVYYFNQRMKEFAKVEDLGDSSYDWRSLIHPDDLKATIRSWNESTDKGKPFSHEHRILMADGKYRWHLSRVVPEPESNNDVRKWFGTATDVHDLKAAEEAFRKAEERLRLSVEAGKLGTWESDPNRRELYWDDRTRELFGIPQNERVAFDETIWKVIPKEEHALVRIAIEKALRSDGDGVYDVEHRIRLNDGSMRWLHNTGLVEFRGEGPHRIPVLIRGTVADVTERKQEETRIALIARLGDLIRTVDDPLELLYAVSRSVGDKLAGRRCLFSEVDLENGIEVIHRDYTNGYPSVAGKRSLDDHGEESVNELRKGRTVVNFDSRMDPRTAQVYEKAYYRTGERSFISVPLMRGGVCVASLRISDDKPREWSPADVRLVESIGERTWLAVEKLRSEAELRDTAARLSLASQVGEYGTWDLNYETNKMIWSEKLFEIFGLENGKDEPEHLEKFESLLDRDSTAFLREFGRNNGEKLKDFSGEYRIRHAETKEERWINAAAKFFYNRDDRAVRCVGVVKDITDRKRQSEELQRAHDELEMRVAERTRQLAETNRALLEEMTEREIAEHQRIELLHRLISSQELERQRIARDIHDQLGQRLTALRLKIASLKEAVTGDPDLAARIQRLQEIAETLDSEVSFLAWELRPTALDDHGFVEAISEFVREWSKHVEIAGEFHATDLAGATIERDAETHLYRIAQEALNNIAKHSGATHVNVLLERREDRIILIIEDNGKGFEPPEAHHPTESGSGGLGLVGMSERAGLVGGEFEIESAHGNGTTIFVRIPLSS